MAHGSGSRPGRDRALPPHGIWHWQFLRCRAQWGLVGNMQEAEEQLRQRPAEEAEQASEDFSESAGRRSIAAASIARLCQACLHCLTTLNSLAFCYIGLWNMSSRHVVYVPGRTMTVSAIPHDFETPAPESDPFCSHGTTANRKPAQSASRELLAVLGAVGLSSAASRLRGPC